MKASTDAILQKEQADYLDGLMTQGDPFFAEMESFGAQNRVPSADREVARFIAITAQAIKAKRALEVGMAIGYTTIHLARAMGEDGLVVPVDPSDEMIKVASGYFERAGISTRIRIERGAALEVIPRLSDTFDLVFIDALKHEYEGYLEAALPKLRIGGVMIVDNLLWGGKVANDPQSSDRDTAALQKFNQHFIKHPQLLAVLLSVGDGLGYAVKVR
ncbi:MAG TPA: O-methyltransferase [Pyrinomonadaceae bacterium]|nr:O-methyltransferase [Pyrinomonadaceae bacterium]